MWVRVAGATERKADTMDRYGIVTTDFGKRSESAAVAHVVFGVDFEKRDGRTTAAHGCDMGGSQSDPGDRHRGSNGEAVLPHQLGFRL